MATNFENRRDDVVDVLDLRYFKFQPIGGKKSFYVEIVTYFSSSRL